MSKFKNSLTLIKTEDYLNSEEMSIFRKSFFKQKYFIFQIYLLIHHLEDKATVHVVGHFAIKFCFLKQNSQNQ